MTSSQYQTATRRCGLSGWWKAVPGSVTLVARGCYAESRRFGRSFSLRGPNECRVDSFKTDDDRNEIDDWRNAYFRWRFLPTLRVKRQAIVRNLKTVSRHYKRWLTNRKFIKFRSRRSDGVGRQPTDSNFVGSVRWLTKRGSYDFLS